MEEQQKRQRRSKSEMDALIVQMREMEVQGKSRKEIALALGLTGPQVTRSLGAVRTYRGKRLAA